MNSGWWGYEYVNESPRIGAWTTHYQAKGCSALKARELACRKVRLKATWPPR